MAIMVILFVFACEIGFNNTDLDNSFECVKSWESVLCLSIPPILFTVSFHTLHIFTGCILGDGSINRRHKVGKGISSYSGRYSMTIASAVYSYHRWLFDIAFAQFSRVGRNLTPWPNPAPYSAPSF